MGWSTGSTLCEDVCNIVKDYVSEKEYVEVSAKICGMFVGMDADDFEFFPGTPYWNYLRTKEQDDFLSMLKERVDDERHTLDEVREWLEDFDYKGFNVMLRKWLEEDVRGVTPEEFYDTSESYMDDFCLGLNEIQAERQAEMDEDRLWNTEF